MEYDPTRPPVRKNGRRLMIHESCFRVEPSSKEGPEWAVLTMDDVVPGAPPRSWKRLSRGDFVRIGMWFLTRAIRL